MGMEMESVIGFSTSHIECEMTKKSDCHSQAETTNHNEKECCNEEFELLVLDQKLQKSTAALDYSPEFVVSLVYTYLGILFFPTATNDNYAEISPPFLRQDLQVLHQSFLI
jgi:hypothetical protein